MNRKSPLVSIIVNCFNGERYLGQCIKSIIDQTYRNWELIFWDNCSTDKSLKIIKKHKDKRIKIFKSKTFNNLYNARNLAIKKTKGTLITFLDADDWWSKNKLKKQVKFLEKNKNYNIIYSNLFLFNEKKNKVFLSSKKKLYNGEITQLLLDNFKMPILTTMIRKKIFSKFSFDKNYNIIGDFDLFIRMSLREKIFSIQEPLAFYRIHDSNMTTKKIELNITELERWFKKNYKNKNFRKYNFSNVKKMIQSLKIKQHCISGNVINVFLNYLSRQ